MKATYQADGARLRVRFESSEELARFVEGVEREAGFVVQLGEALALHQEVTLELGRDDTSVELTGRVAQVFDKGFGRFGTALLVDDLEALAGLREPGGAPTGEDPEGAEEAIPESPEPADEASAGEMRGTSPIHRIKSMNPRQRALLAMKAGRTERQILLRDNSPQVLQNLINNPRIDAEEVLQLTRSSHVVAPVLQRIAGDARWNGNQDIFAIIRRSDVRSDGRRRWAKTDGVRG